VPPEAELSARPQQVSAWADVADGIKPVHARQMEVYVGFMEHTDHHITCSSMPSRRWGRWTTRWSSSEPCVTAG
jgi:hypothetical protein